MPVRTPRKQSDLVAFDPVARPRASVIVPAWKDSPHLMGCLRSLASSTGRVEFEVLVALNAPTDQYVMQLKDAVMGVEVLPSEVNLGFAGACNRAAAKASGEYLVLLNDDTVVEDGWLDALTVLADDRPNAGAVGSCLVDPDGTLQEAGALLWSDGSTTAVGEGLGPGAWEWDFARRVDYCSGAGLLVRADLWRTIGGFDEGYFPAYCEDVELCLELDRLGHQVWYQPRARLRHVRHGSMSIDYAWFLTHRNRRRLVTRWHDALSRRPDRVRDDEAAVADAVWRAMGSPRRVLFADADARRALADAVALAGSGAAMASTVVIAAPIDHPRRSDLGVRRARGPLDDHLRAPVGTYDVVVTPSDAPALVEIVRSRLPGAVIVHGAEALDVDARQILLTVTPPPAGATGAGVADAHDSTAGADRWSFDSELTIAGEYAAELERRLHAALAEGDALRVDVVALEQRVAEFERWRRRSAAESAQQRRRIDELVGLLAERSHLGVVAEQRLEEHRVAVAALHAELAAMRRRRSVVAADRLAAALAAHPRLASPARRLARLAQRYGVARRR